MVSAVDRQSMARLMTWPALAAVFFVWPILSCFPIFAIVEHEKTFAYVTVQLLFLVTGFWTAAIVVVFTAATLQDEARSRFRKALSGRIGQAAWYAAAWTILYMFVGAFARL